MSDDRSSPDGATKEARALAYERDPYLRALETGVVETSVAEGGVEVVLEDTVFYPEGGGQPSDSGTVGGEQVRHVRKSAGVVCHLLDEAPVAGRVRLELDWTRRFDHMQQHTAQHLLTALAQDRFGLSTTAFHLGIALSDIELDTPKIASTLRAELEVAANEAIRQARAVTTREVDAAAVSELGARSRGLAAGHVGPVRLVEIEGVDLSTCGGTHVRSLAEVQVVKLLGAEPMRGGARLHFVAGERVLRRLAEHESRGASLRRLLDVPDEEVVAAVEGRLEQLGEARRQGRSLREELARAVAGRLAARGEAVVAEHDESGDMASLQAFGRAFVDLRPDGTLLLTAGSGRAGCFVLAVGSAIDGDVQALGRGVAEQLGGRGGGRPPLFQGKATRLELLPEAASWLRQQLG